MNACASCCQAQRGCCDCKSIDYKAGNLTSVCEGAEFFSSARDVVVTQSPEVVRSADKVVLPGSWTLQATQLLDELGLTEAVRESIGPKARGFWASAVGLQWLFEGSTEADGTKGFGRVLRECVSISRAVYGRWS